MKIYLAGPMSGIPQFNYPAFHAAAAALRAMGHEVVNPADCDPTEYQVAAMASVDGSHESIAHLPNSSWGCILAEDVKTIAEDGIEGIVVLPGWENSRGAKLEVFVAMLCALPVWEYEHVVGLRGLPQFARAPHKWVLGQIAHSMFGTRQ
jgi:hypothetical protein